MFITRYFWEEKFAFNGSMQREFVSQGQQRFFLYSSQISIKYYLLNRFLHKNERMQSRAMMFMMGERKEENWLPLETMK
jgi:hypothetical protein